MGWSMRIRARRRKSEVDLGAVEIEVYLSLSKRHDEQFHGRLAEARFSSVSFYVCWGYDDSPISRWPPRTENPMIFARCLLNAQVSVSLPILTITKRPDDTTQRIPGTIHHYIYLERVDRRANPVDSVTQSLIFMLGKTKREWGMFLFSRLLFSSIWFFHGGGLYMYYDKSLHGKRGSMVW